MDNKQARRLLERQLLLLAMPIPMHEWFRDTMNVINAIYGGESNIYKTFYKMETSYQNEFHKQMWRPDNFLRVVVENYKRKAEAELNDLIVEKRKMVNIEAEHLDKTEVLQNLKTHLTGIKNFQNDLVPWLNVAMDLVERLIGFGSKHVSVLTALKQDTEKLMCDKDYEQREITIKKALTIATFELETTIEEVENKNENLNIQPPTLDKKKSFWYDAWVSGTGTKLLAEIIIRLSILFASSTLFSTFIKIFSKPINLSVWQLGLIIFAVTLILFFIVRSFYKSNKS